MTDPHLRSRSYLTSAWYRPSSSMVPTPLSHWRPDLSLPVMALIYTKEGASSHAQPAPSWVCARSAKQSCRQ